MGVNWKGWVADDDLRYTEGWSIPVPKGRAPAENRSGKVFLPDDHPIYDGNATLNEAVFLGAHRVQGSITVHYNSL